MLGELVLIIECCRWIYRPGASWTTRVIIALLYARPVSPRRVQRPPVSHALISIKINDLNMLKILPYYLQ